jgi:hypothetical protein
VRKSVFIYVPLMAIIAFVAFRPGQAGSMFKSIGGDTVDVIGGLGRFVSSLVGG